MEKEKQKYQDFCKNLTDRYLKELSGEGENSDYIYNIRPTEKIVIGILDSNIQNEESTRYRSIPIVKVQFFMDNNIKGDYKIDFSGNLYYNVLPTYEEQKDHFEKQKKEKENRKFDDIEPQEEIESIDNYNKTQFILKYKKISVDNIWNNIVISKKDLLEKGKINISKRLNDALYSLDFSDSVFFDTREIQTSILDSKEKYEQYIKTHFGDADNQIIHSIPKWEFNAYLECKQSNEKDKSVVTLVFENVTEKGQDYKANDFENKKYSTPLFNVGLTIEPKNGAKFEEIELDNFEKSYKVNSKVVTKGEWLSAEYEDGKIVTKNVPQFIEKRLITKDAYNANTDLKNLQKKPIENLKTILEGMNDYYRIISSQNIDDNDYKSDLRKFKQEIRRFEIGIQILEDPEFESMKKAFICMNKTFEGKLSSWRLFQIVFITSMISDIVYNENKDYLESEIYNYKDYGVAELIYFPTGGGKTEAFLGTVILSAFYDRFIGKNYGVNTIIKYPLRLLSIQQLERTLEVILRANKVLKEDDEIKNSPIFTLGYFVGSSNTPNVIKEDEISKYEHKKEYILVDKCPECGEKIDVIYNNLSKVLEHKCTKCGHVLPLYIVDNEIYRFLPTVLISTVDKLATISLNDGFRNILGGTKYRCLTHGFSHNSSCTCNIHDSMEDIYKNQIPSLAPTLFIQDEVHLLKESLGVFSSHYESLLNYYMENLIDEKHRKKVKYIGATATISGADYLVKELYDKDCRIFPSPSTYSTGENFYSKLSEDEITRIIVGFAPFGDSINARIEYAVSTLRLILNEMYNNPKKYSSKYEMTDEEFKKMIFYYWTSIVYFRAKNDNNKLRNTFEQQANYGRMKDTPDANFNIVRMTGDEDFSQIKESLNSMTSTDNKRETDNLILATSTISHGVDSKYFNNIFFYGIPSNTAEYIQSYSRVGRTYTGLVVDIIRLARNRDVSFLKYFNMMHNYKDYLINETRLIPKSTIAMYRTFPGIFISLLKHYYSVKDSRKYETLGEVDSFFFSNGNPRKENISDFLDKLFDIYKIKGLDSENSIYANFKKEVQSEFLNTIVRLHNSLRTFNTVNKQLKSHIKEFTKFGFSAMTSLRDVDVNYDIGLQFGGNENEEK